MENFPLQEYSSRYKVSRCGNIYSNRKKSYLNKTISDGYNVIYVNKLKSKNTQILRVDNLVATVFVKKDDTEFDYLVHKDGDKLNDKADNLEWTSIERYLYKKYNSIWKQIRDMPYYVSNNGQVWSKYLEEIIQQ